jgi:hypothetical protein
MPQAMTTPEKRELRLCAGGTASLTRTERRHAAGFRLSGFLVLICDRATRCCDEQSRKSAPSAIRRRFVPPVIEALTVVPPVRAAAGRIRKELQLRSDLPRPSPPASGQTREKD